MFETKLKSSKPHYTYNIKLDYHGTRSFVSWLKKLTYKKVSISLKGKKASKSFTFSTIKERKAFASSFEAMGNFFYDELKVIKQEAAPKDKPIQSLNKLEELRLNNYNNGIFDIQSYFHKLTMDAFTKIAFSVDVGSIKAAPKQDQFALRFELSQKCVLSSWSVYYYWLQVSSLFEFESIVC